MHVDQHAGGSTNSSIWVWFEMCKIHPVLLHFQTMLSFHSDYLDTLISPLFHAHNQTTLEGSLITMAKPASLLFRHDKFYLGATVRSGTASMTCTVVLVERLPETILFCGSWECLSVSRFNRKSHPPLLCQQQHSAGKT